jgi:HSP20 family protein
MTAPARRSHHSLLPDFTDVFGGFPGIAGWPFAFEHHGIRIEDRMEQGRYLIRAELPDVDPNKDVDVTVQEGMLTIRAERQEERSRAGHSEFRYGTFTRTIALPSGAREDDINASYASGILTVSVGIDESKETGRRVPVQRTD